MQPEGPLRHSRNHSSIGTILISLALEEIGCIQANASMAVGEAELQKSEAR